MQINSNYYLIESKKNLDLFLVGLGKSGTISVDTESSGYFTYFSKICLIQITSNGRNYILDPLQGYSLQGLGDLFENSSFLKIFHSASDDIKALKRDFQFSFKNIADTMYSSKLLSFQHNSLNYLVERYHKVKLSKTEQKSNWEKRPLQKNQLTYAVLDTAYLESIWENMKADLSKKNLLEEALSEFEKIAKEELKIKENHQVQWHKFPNIFDFSPVERRYILDILEYREEKAKKLNRAPFRILNNESISKIIRHSREEKKIFEIAGHRDGSEILRILKESSGVPLEKENIPKDTIDLTDEEEKIFQVLKGWRTKLMKTRNMDHTLVPSNKSLMLLSQKKPKTIEEIDELGILSEWKLMRYAPSMLAAIKGLPFDHFLHGLPTLSQKEKK